MPVRPDQSGTIRWLGDAARHDFPMPLRCLGRRCQLFPAAPTRTRAPAPSDPSPVAPDHGDDGVLSPGVRASLSPGAISPRLRTGPAQDGPGRRRR